MWYLPKCSRGTPCEGYEWTVVHDILLKSAWKREKYKVIKTVENLKGTELVHIWINVVYLGKAWRGEQSLWEEKYYLINLVQFFDPITELASNIDSIDKSDFISKHLTSLNRDA